MSSRRPAARRLLQIALVLAGPLAAGRASAQLQTADPYDPYGGGFRGSTYPGYVNDPSLYNRPIFRPSGGPNQMDSFYRNLDGSGTGAGDGGNRYDQRFRSYADSIGRNGPIENEADLKFYKNSLRRDELFYLIQREKDPKEKAKLSAELKKLSADLNRELSARRPPRSGAPSVLARGRDKVKSAAVSGPVALPAYATFGPLDQPVAPSASLPIPARLGGIDPSPTGAGSASARRPAPDRSPSSVLDRALRSETRRPPPPIPGVGDSPR